MEIIIGLGSNNDAEHNIQMAEERLRSLFPAIRFSQSLHTEPVGMPDGTAWYINAVAIADTSLPYPALRAVLKAIERQHGRTPELKRKGIVPLDLDILQYADRRTKPQDWFQPFNIQLIAEIR